MMRSAVLALVVAAAPLSAQTPKLPSVTLPAELNRVLTDYSRAWKANDLDGLVALFTKDGHVPTRSGWMRGEDAIRKEYARAGGDLQLRAVSYAMKNDIAYIIGEYWYGDTPRGAKFILTLAKQNGKWLITADLPG